MALNPAAPNRRRTALRGLLTLAWQVPALAVGFGLFFWLITGLRAGNLPAFIAVSGLFALVNSLLNWLGANLLYDRLVPPGSGGTRPVAHTVAFFGLLNVGGCFLSALLAGPLLGFHMLTSGRSVVVLLVFTLLFFALFIGLSLARTYYRSAVQRVREDEELKLARRIQQAFLPSRFPSHPGFEVHAVNISSKQVSGDFYDVMPAGEHALLLAIADVSGKGFPAALLGSMLQASLRTQAGEKDSTAAITQTVNALTTGADSTGKFVTLFLAHLDQRSLRLRYTNAGHNPPLLFRSAGGHQALEEGGTVVGAFQGLSYEEGAVDLRPGDRLVLYTDGVTEAVNRRGEMFGEERLIPLIASLPADLSARGIVDATMAELNTFLGDLEPGDDITMMVLRIPAA